MTSLTDGIGECQPDVEGGDKEEENGESEGSSSDLSDDDSDGRSEKAGRPPWDLKVSPGWRGYLHREGYEYMSPSMLARGMTLGCQERTSPQCNGEFAVYAATVDLGLRFPPHLFVCEILDGFNLGVAQLTPNLWATILGYIAKCELKHLPMTFSSFLRMVTLSRAPKSAEGWFSLGCRPGYMMVVKKPSKHHNWRRRWVVFHTNNMEMYHRMGRWEASPNFLKKDDSLPLILIKS